MSPASHTLNAEESNLKETAHTFGGAWTTQKLEILQKYLAAYSTALAKQPFKKVYIDAFAGTGYRENSISKAKKKTGQETDGENADQPSLLDSLAGSESSESVQGFLDGSAIVALKSQPAFDEYIFIEQSPSRCKSLEMLKSEFPLASKKIFVERADANTFIQALCKQNWNNRRGVLFLDPYGAQVNWATIEAISETKAIDLWVLFPLSGVNRMLTQSGDIDPKWRLRLNEIFGTTGWEQELYQRDEKPSLFEESEQRIIKATTTAISDYFLKRLQTCFPFVAPKPAVLYNSKLSPLFLFCFAAGNPNGGPIALKIAKHILKMGM